MISDKPTVEPFERSIARLEEGLVRFLKDISDDQIRDGLIQRFEFTYEQSHKVLKRYLEYASANPTLIDAMTFQELIREGNVQGLLLGEWLDWRGFRDMRNSTSHTYDEETALKVVEDIPRFVDEVKFLRERLRERLL